jgi:hypothetical protein
MDPILHQMNSVYTFTTAYFLKINFHVIPHLHTDTKKLEM